jgi:hypothetical protein
MNNSATGARVAIMAICGTLFLTHLMGQGFLAKKYPEFFTGKQQAAAADRPAA